MNKNGVIYCAYGKKYIIQAEISCNSLKKQSPEINTTIFTDNKNYYSPIWDKIIKIQVKSKNLNLPYETKLKCLQESPYNKTIYLDTDTYILDDISDIFTILDRFDFALCHGHNRFYRYKIQHGLESYQGKLHKVINNDIPYGFAPVQSGLISYKKSKEVNKFLSDLIFEYNKKNFFDDQASIRELLWNSQLRFYILPPEYNFNSFSVLKKWKINNYIDAKPKILHYTKDKNRNIKRLISKKLKDRPIFDRFYRVFFK